jgi:tRNA(Ile)-lysidine synthase
LLNLKANIFDVFKNALAEYCQGVFVIIDDAGGFSSKIANIRNTIEYCADNPLVEAQNIKALCVAYSGGLDSTVLLDVADMVCKEAKVPLSAFHINHGISSHAQQWQAHCKRECDRRGIPFFTQSISLTKSPQQSLEAQARDARYKILDKHASESTVVLLAQHQDDQAETLLLQLKRGAGLKGLSAMPAFTTKSNGKCYLRPFLGLSRADLLSHAQQYNLIWIEDESNQDNNYDRNFLRNKIIPQLANRWPAINKTIARSAFNCAQAEQVNTEYMCLLAKDLINANKAVVIEHLLSHSPATQQSFIRHWLSNVFPFSLSSAQLNSVLTLTKASNNSSPYIKLADVAVERFQGKLHVIERMPNQETLVDANPIKLDWHNRSVIQLNQFIALRMINESEADSKEFAVSNEFEDISPTQIFCLPREGVTCVFGGSNLSFKSNAKRPTKKLKVWYQEWQISPLQRLKTPVFVNQTAALAVGLSTVKISCSDVYNEITVALLNTRT